MNQPVLIHAEEIAPQPWRNGGGRTRELLTWPAGANPWQLRISLAEVRSDGPFSLFPGIERWFTVIDGAGVRLLLDTREHRLQPDSAPLQFSGAVPAFCTLIDGATTDLNLMHAGGQASMLQAQSGLSWRSSLPQRGVFTRTAGLWRAGDASSIRLPARCLLWLDGAADQSWTFHAGNPSATVPALWLGFVPDAHGPAVHDADTRVQT